MSEAFRGLLGIGFEHKVLVRRYQQDVREVDKITLKELLEEEDPRMKAGDRDGWRFFLEHILCELLQTLLLCSGGLYWVLIAFYSGDEVHL